MESIIIKLIDLIVFFVANPLKRDFEVGKLLKKVGLLKLEANFDSKFIHSIIEFGKDKTNHQFIVVLKDKKLRKEFQNGIVNDDLDEFKKKAEFALHKKLSLDNVTTDKPYEQIIDEFVKTFESVDKKTESKTILDFINDTNHNLFELSESNYKNSFEYKIDKYKKDLVNSFKTSYPEKEPYVDLNGVMKKPSKIRFPAKKLKKGEPVEDSFIDLDATAEKHYNPIDSYIDVWLADPNKNFLIILGEYGTGKTTLCHYIAYNLEKSILENSIETKILDPDKRTPIIFNLRNFRNQSLDAFLISELSMNANEVSFMDFKERLKKDELILIFDGFDEMAAEIDVRGKTINFDFIFDILKIYKNSKIILTSRIEYFQSLQEQSEALKTNEENVDTIYIKLFEEPQILEFIERMKGEPSKNWEEIKAINGLKDLVRRPVLLNLIVKHLKKILQEAKKEVKSIDVFKAAIDDELKEIRKKFRKDDRDYGTDDATRMRILKKVCISLFIKNQLSIPIIEIADYAKNDPDLINRNAAQIENYLTNFHTYTFFARDRDDIFRISHKAFIDYLAAKELFMEINNNIENIGKQQFNAAIIHFICEMKPDRTILEKLVKEEDTTEAKKWVKSNAVNLILKIDNPKYDGNVDFNNNKIRLSDTNLKDISILQELKNITELYLSNNQITNLEPLQELKNLTLLLLDDNQITNLEPLQELNILKVLHIDNNHISNLEPLKELKNLRVLYLNNNQISNLEPLKELKSITDLQLSKNIITNLESLKDLKNITNLWLNSNKIIYLEPIQELRELTWLRLENNKIINLESLKDLKKLIGLVLSANQIIHLEQLNYLEKVENLWLTNNQISNLKPLKELKNLIQLYLTENQITDLIPLKELKELKYLYLSSNQISNHDSLKEMKNLEIISLSNNPLKESQIIELEEAIPDTNIIFD